MDFSILKGQDLVKLGRAADMLWMNIGDAFIITGPGGQKRVVNRYAFHMQCPWRFSQNKRIMLGSLDTCKPAKVSLVSGIDWDWDVPLNKTLLPLTVTDVTEFNNGDLRITFDKDTVFELFVPGSVEREYWRFIDFEKEFHHAVFGE